VHGGAARALKRQSSQLTHHRVPLSADQSRDSAALFAGGAIDQIASYDFNSKHWSMYTPLFEDSQENSNIYLHNCLLYKLLLDTL
jgi:hypothetical protein